MDDAPPSGGVVRRLRAVRRGVAILLFTVPAGFLQGLFLMLPGRGQGMVRACLLGCAVPDDGSAGSSAGDIGSTGGWPIDGLRV